MAEENITPEAPAEAPAGPEMDTDAGKKALDAERKNARAAARERDALAARLKEFEDRDKSETQRLAERAEAAERRAVEVELRAMRLEVAAEKGLNPSQAKRLLGTTREEIEADADELIATFAPPPLPDEPPSAARRPVESLRPGAAPAAPALNSDGLTAALERAVGVR